MQTLKEIEQLEQSRYGRPRPRHGLKLLYWFANDCLSLDQNNVLQLSCYPMNGDFGFHRFKNRYEIRGSKLLPDVNFPYYVVGNLSYLDASKFPKYVREDYTGSQDNSIIVSIDNKWVHTVYVTEHRERSSFSKYATYHISRHLIMIIRGLTLEEFLLRTGYSSLQRNIFPITPVNTPTYLSNPEPSCPTLPSAASSMPSITSSKNHDICIEIESPPTTRNNNTRRKWISNLPASSQDNQITSNHTPPIISSRSQDKDIESSPVSLMNSCEVTDDTQTFPTSIFGMVRCCICTIL